MKQLFNLLDGDGDDLVDFENFCSALFNYCSYDYESLVKFAFYLIDVNHTQRIEKEDFRLFLDLVYGKANRAKTDKRIDTVMELFGKSKKDTGGISLPEFLAFSKKCPLLMYPAFYIQNILRNKTLGSLYWEKRTKARTEQAMREQSVYEMIDGMRLRRRS